MSFSELLNDYISTIDCTSKELSDKSMLSNSTISRYRSGERVPFPSAKSADIVSALSSALVQLANEKGVEFPEERVIFDAFISSLAEKDFSVSASKMNLLIDALKINASELASALNYDPSYISRVRANKRQPYDIPSFISKVSQYIVEHFKSTSNKEIVAAMIGVSLESIKDNTAYYDALNEWLGSDSFTATSNFKPDPSSFLSKVDEFNLSDYIEAIHYNDIKVPSLPFYISPNKTYLGLKAIKDGELDFFKATVLSKSSEDVFLFNDMPMEDLAKDPEFSKKWMFGLAVMLKKGLHINMVHNLNRPFNELMMGLEGWIPLYMTGQISPYYLKEKTNDVFGHVHYSSGEAALVGDCLISHHDRAHYYLTRKKDEVAIYREYDKYLLEEALPLMKIYRFENMEEFASFLPSTLNCPKGILHRYTSLPIFTLDADELLSILIKNDLGERETDFMLRYHRAIKDSFEKVLENHTITDEVVYIDEENFDEKKPYLLLTETFCSKQIYYTRELYEKHLKKTEEFAKEHPNYTFIRTKKNPYKNIQITVVRDKWALISKSTNPNIHFVIHHPILRDAIENMIFNNRD